MNVDDLTYSSIWPFAMIREALEAKVNLRRKQLLLKLKNPIRAHNEQSDPTPTGKPMSLDFTFPITWVLLFLLICTFFSVFPEGGILNWH